MAIPTDSELQAAEYRGAAFGALLMLDKRNPGESFFAADVASASRNLTGINHGAVGIYEALEQLAERGELERAGAAYRLCDWPKAQAAAEPKPASCTDCGRGPEHHNWLGECGQ